MKKMKKQNSEFKINSRVKTPKSGKILRSATSQTSKKKVLSEPTKIFKKLSMSFYNWATKIKKKQVVCQNFNTSFGSTDKHKRSVTELNTKTTAQNLDDLDYAQKSISIKNTLKSNEIEIQKGNRINQYFDQMYKCQQNTKKSKKLRKIASVHIQTPFSHTEQIMNKQQVNNSMNLLMQKLKSKTKNNKKSQSKCKKKMITPIKIVEQKKILRKLKDARK